MKTKRALIASICTIVLGVSAASALWVYNVRRNKVPDFSGKSREEISKYFQSDEYRNMDPNSRRRIARETFGRMMTLQAKEYCELPLEKRVAYLDNIIDEMQNRRREFISRNGGPRDRPQGPRRPRPDRRRDRAGSKGGLKICGHGVNR